MENIIKSKTNLQSLASSATDNDVTGSAAGTRFIMHYIDEYNPQKYRFKLLKHSYLRTKGPL